MKRASVLAMSLVAMVCVSMSAAADTLNRHIGYSGFLATGSPPVAVNGPRDLVFRIYTVLSGGTAVWEETHSVEVVEGEFSVNLGKNHLNGLDDLDFSSDVQYWLGITIGLFGTELSPRKEILFVPYAFRGDSAAAAETAETADTAISIETRSDDPATPVDGQIWLRTDL